MLQSTSRGGCFSVDSHTWPRGKLKLFTCLPSLSLSQCCTLLTHLKNNCSKTMTMMKCIVEHENNFMSTFTLFHAHNEFSPSLLFIPSRRSTCKNVKLNRLELLNCSSIHVIRCCSHSLSRFSESPCEKFLQN